MRPDARGSAAQPPHLRDRGLGERAARADAAERRPANELVARRRRRGRALCGAAGARAGRTGAGSRRDPAIASRPAECSASSTTFAGFQFHIPPEPGALEVARAERAALARSRAAPARSAPARARGRCRATDATPRSAPSASGASGSPRPARGTPRAPSTRRCALRASASRRPARDRRRRARRARCGGCGRRSRSSRAGRSRGAATVASTSAAVPLRAREA